MFHPRGSKLSLYVNAVGNHFRDRDQCLNFPYLDVNPIHGQKFQIVHVQVHVLYALGGRNRAYFCSTGSSFRDRFLKCPYLGINLGQKQRFQKLHGYFLTPGCQNEATFALSAA